MLCVENCITKAKSLNVQFETDVDLKKYCTYGTGGKGTIMFFPNSKEQVKNIKEAFFDEKIVFLGGGSNVLISDKGFNGVIINTKFLDKIKFSALKVTCESGVKISKLIDESTLNSLSGLEFLSGIPATVGGAVCMNAGCFDSCVGDFVSYVITDRAIYNGKACEFGYRDSIFRRNGECIIEVGFTLENEEYDTIVERKNNYLSMRKAKQPKGRSGGSVFKNDGYYSAKLIDGCNLKNYRIGGAVVSQKHANFIIAENNATSNDIKRLIDYVKDVVKDKTDTQLVEEIIYIGDFS